MMTTEERINQLPACKECGAVQFVRYGHFAECSQFLSDANEEQPMSDTLLEPEDQTGEHQVTKSGTCAIPGCPCRGWSAQETAGVKEVAEYHPPTLIDAAKGIEQWWLERGMHAFSGAPAAMFDLRAAIADYDEQQPAARGGGDEWRVAQRYDGAVLIVRAESDNRETPLLTLSKSDDDYVMADRIVTEHNQHQSLVAEREQMLDALKGVATTLNTELEKYDKEPWARRVRAAIVTSEQRSTSE